MRSRRSSCRGCRRSPARRSTSSALRWAYARALTPRVALANGGPHRLHAGGERAHRRGGAPEDSRRGDQAREGGELACACARCMTPFKRADYQDQLARRRQQDEMASKRALQDELQRKQEESVQKQEGIRKGDLMRARQSQPPLQPPSTTSSPFATSTTWSASRRRCARRPSRPARTGTSTWR